ncbi:hypothetical protein PFLUV_G00021780 [Perca fluviatilis]|uniref:Uncharacterized protein n=1 Tax=Perca fluviatilis TaxID=8168 RepID=A0A6A5FQ48_PERFL|nr:hypothetical protein PFLUV_G00021780 [Perca fluviatilis]
MFPSTAKPSQTDAAAETTTVPVTTATTEAPDPDAVACSGRPFDSFMRIKNGSIYAFRGATLTCTTTTLNVLSASSSLTCLSIMTNTTSLIRTGRASSLQWMLSWPAEFTSLPGALATPRNDADQQWGQQQGQQWNQQQYQQYGQQWGREGKAVQPTGDPRLSRGMNMGQDFAEMGMEMGRRLAERRMEMEERLRRDWDRRRGIKTGTRTDRRDGYRQNNRGNYDPRDDRSYWASIQRSLPIQSVYFFKGDTYSRVDLRTKRVDPATPPYPRSIAKYWLGCSDTTGAEK